MSEDYQVNWGLDNLGDKLPKENKKFCDIYAECTAKEWIEHLIITTHLKIKFKEKLKREYNEKDKRELKKLQKLFSKYCSDRQLEDHFIGRYMELKKANVAQAKIDFGHLITQAVNDIINAHIKSIDRGKLKINVEVGRIKRECFLDIKETLKQSQIKNFEVEAKNLMEYNDLKFDFSHVKD